MQVGYSGARESIPEGRLLERLFQAQLNTFEHIKGPDWELYSDEFESYCPDEISFSGIIIPYDLLVQMDPGFRKLKENAHGFGSRINIFASFPSLYLTYCAENSISPEYLPKIFDVTSDIFDCFPMGKDRKDFGYPSKIDDKFKQLKLYSDDLKKLMNTFNLLSQPRIDFKIFLYRSFMPQLDIFRKNSEADRLTKEQETTLNEIVDNLMS